MSHASFISICKSVPAGFCSIVLHVMKTNWNHCRQKQKLHPLTLLMFQGNKIIFCLASRSLAAKLQSSSQIVNIRLSIHIFTFSITGGLSSQLLPHYQEILLPYPWMLHKLIEKEKKNCPLFIFHRAVFRFFFPPLLLPSARLEGNLN